MRSIMVVLVATSLLGARRAPVPTFEQVYPLREDEGVFAYSRISPDGRYIGYASQKRAAGLQYNPPTTQVFVDLATKKVLFRESGMDAYFSSDGTRAIYLNMAGRGVALYTVKTGDVKYGIAPRELGDYFSWATHKGRDLILTVQGNYYYLDGDEAVRPYGKVQPCGGVPVARPLISHDGTRISTFANGTVVIRSLFDCSYIFDTGIRGAKTVFSWDGRYVAMHAPRTSSSSVYDIYVVDLKDRTVRNVTESLKGSSYFPNWTRDGRLSFRYDGDDYRGFLFARNVLSAKPRAISSRMAKLPATRSWADIFPETPRTHEYELVVVYGTWSAHTPIALMDLQKTAAFAASNGLNVGIATATDPTSRERDVVTLLKRHEIALPRIPLAPTRASLTEVTNQSPATLLFRDGVLIDRRLGAQTFEELRDWLGAAGVKPSPQTR